MTRLLAVCAILLTGLASVAHANGVDVTANPIVQRDLRVAEQYWGKQAAQCPAVTVNVGEPQGPVAGNDGALVPAAEVGAATAIDGCEILLTPDTWASFTPVTSGIWARFTHGPDDPPDRQQGCMTIIHEYGHLIGLADVPGGGIMDMNVARMPVPACVAAWPSLRPPAPPPAIFVYKRHHLRHHSHPRHRRR